MNKELIGDILAGIFILGGMGLTLIVGIVGFVKVWRESKNTNNE